MINYEKKLRKLKERAEHQEQLNNTSMYLSPAEVKMIVSLLIKLEERVEIKL